MKPGRRTNHNHRVATFSIFYYYGFIVEVDTQKFTPPDCPALLFGFIRDLRFVANSKQWQWGKPCAAAGLLRPSR